MKNLSIEINTFKNGIYNKKIFNSFNDFINFCDTLNDNSDFLLSYKNNYYNIYDCDFFNFKTSLFSEIYDIINGRMRFGYNFFNLTLKNVDTNKIYSIIIEFHLDDIFFNT